MRVLTLLSGLFLLFSAAGAAAQPEAQSHDPYSFVEQVAQSTFRRIQQDKDLIADQPRHMRTIVRDELVPHLDYRFAAFKVLGQYFRHAPRAQLEEFVTVFRDYLVVNYASALTVYEDQSVDFQPGNKDRLKRFAVVRAVIREPGKPDIKLSFKVRRAKGEDNWKAFDLVAEGVSMIDSKRSEFGQIIRRGGLGEAIARMRQAIDRGSESTEALARVYQREITL